MKKLADYSLRLSIVCIIASGLLAVVYNNTSARIRENIQSEKLSKAESVLSGRADEIKVFRLGEKEFFRGFSSGKLAGTVIETCGTGYGGEVRVLSGIGTDGKIIDITILSHKETPGLGSKVTDPRFKDQFRIKKPQDVDTIASATISSKAVISAVQKALDKYEAVKNAR
jgi:Na+-translocating ferredoxin:NAD+ oxidoreductase subunit G